MTSSLMQGRFKYQVGQVRAFGMLAGGSGITPMFQVTINPEFYIVICYKALLVISGLCSVPTGCQSNS